MLKVTNNINFHAGAPFAWKRAEQFLNFGQKSYKVVKIENHVVYLELASQKLNKIKTLIKVILCFSLALPLTIAAALITTHYRKNYSFKIIEKKPVVQDLPINKILTDPPNNDIIKSAYKIDEVIAKIIQAKDEGVKVGIFLGRDNTQVLPQEEGWKWFSLDINLKEGETGHHLKMDFNAPAEMQKIKGLFNKAIIDYSTLKCFNKPWPTLVKLLQDDPDSSAICEARTNFMGSTNLEPVFLPMKATMILPRNNNYIQERNHFEGWKKKVGEAEVAQRYQKFCQKNESSIANIAHWSKEQINQELELRFMREILKEENLEVPERSYLPDLYAEIKKCVESNYFLEAKLESGLFPYRIGEEAIHMDYWVMRSPKCLG